MLNETKTNKVCCIVNFNEKNNVIDVLDRLEIFNTYGFEYYAILHDRDTNKDGVLKTKHLHIILCRITRSRPSYFLNRVCETLQVNQNQVSIMPCENLYASIQYLIHKNDNDKFAYAPFDIYTNTNTDLLNDILNMDLSTAIMDFNYLEMIYEQCGGNRILIMKSIGLGRYNAFRNTINDFINLYDSHYRQK